MRLASTLCSSVLSAVIFAALWSGFVIRQHSYGGDTRLSQFGGTLLYFCIYLLPVLVVISLVVCFAGEALVAKKKIRALVAWRWLSWLFVSVVVLGGLTILANPALWVSSITCSAVAGFFGGIVYFSLLKKKEANQASEPTSGLAPGRGSL
jgi:uncharacterized protein involved in cysteine biosynthesis